MVDIKEKTRLCSVCYKMCRDVCSVAGATRHEADSPHNRGFFAQQVIEGKEELSAEIADYFFRCSMCKACREACETGMDTSEVMLAARKDLAEGLLPEKVRAVKQAVILGTYWGGDSPEVKKLLSGRELHDDSAVLLYFGRRLRSENGDYVRDAVTVMDRLGVKGGVLLDEPSTGQIAHFLGFTDGAKRLGATFSEAIRKSGARVVVVFCADDLRMIIKEYPALGVEIPGITFTSLPEFLLKALTEKKPVLKKWEGSIVTYHDPCALGRELRVFEAPRQIIRLVASSDFREMALSGDQAPCCGWGMGLEITHPDITGLMATRLALMAGEIGADTLVTGCPTCKDVIMKNLDSGRSEIGEDRILDLVQFVGRVLP
jgi:Fe-S oxidoreductase